MNKKTQTTVPQKAFLLLLGLILAIILLEIGLRSAGFVITFFQERSDQSSLRENGSYVIMCLGESTTFFGGNNSYPRQLEEVLQERCGAGKFNVLNKGLPGTRSPAILADLEKNLDEYKPDLVITMMGINDGEGTSVFQDSPGMRFKLFMENFRVYKLAMLLKDHIVLKFKGATGHGGIKREDDSQPSILTGENDNHATRADLPPIKDRKINPPPGEGNLESITYCASQDNWRDIAPLVKQAIESIPGIRPQLYKKIIEIADNCNLRGIFEEVEGFYMLAIEIYPEGDRAYAQLSQYYRKRKRFDEAEELGLKAIEINPQNDIALTVLGQIYSMRGDWEKGEEMYKKSVEANPRRIYPLF